MPPSHKTSAVERSVYHDGFDWTYHHELKTWPTSFQAIADEVKRFDVRPHDRDYQEGQWLRLREWNPDREDYTGRESFEQITYMLSGAAAEQFGLKPGYCVLGLSA